MAPVKAKDLEKALNPTVWPLRVKVHEFIHCRSLRKEIIPDQSLEIMGLIDGNIYNVLDNDVQAN